MRRDLSHHPLLLLFSVVLTFLVMILSHTIHVWIWAILILWKGAVSNLADAVYFSLVTYTTVGYGDVTLGEAYRILGAMASVTGLFNFGLSTAFQVSLFSRLFPRHLG